MPSSFTHAFVGGALGKVCFEPKTSRRIILITIFLGVMPDFDVVGNWLGAGPNSMLGHRGITHSLFFAAIVGAIATKVVARELPRFSRRWWRLYLTFSFVIASHAFLDMFNYGNLGVALFAPFDDTRYFFPIRLIVDAPRVEYFIQWRTLYALAFEVTFVWTPLALYTWRGEIFGWFADVLPETDSVQYS